MFADISGFTMLSEKLAKLGQIGAEEMASAITTCFSDLLTVAYDEGGGLIKFGGDALLILFDGADHAVRAARAAYGMRKRLQTVGKLVTPGGRVNLRMSVGVHSGAFDFFLVGNSHRELIVTGPGSTRVVEMEGTATAGEIVLSPATIDHLPGGCVGAAKGEGWLLRSAPRGEAPSPTWVLPELDAATLEGSVPDGDPRDAARRDQRARAPAGMRRVPALRRDRRDLGDAGPRGARGRPATARRRDPGGGRRVRDLLPRLRRRRRRRQADHDRRRPEGEPGRRGADAARAAPDRRRGLRDPVPDRRQQGSGLRGRRRATLPPHVHRDGRRREPGRARDGEGASRPGAGDGLDPRCLRHPVRDPGARALHGEGQARPGDRVPGRADRRRAGALRRGRSSARRAPGGDRRDRRCDGGRQGGPRPHDRDRRSAGDRQDAPAARAPVAGRGVRAPRGDLRAVRPGDRVRAVPRAAARRARHRPAGARRGCGAAPSDQGVRGVAGSAPVAAAARHPGRRRGRADAGGGRPRPGVPAREARVGGGQAPATAVRGPARARDDRGRPLDGRRFGCAVVEPAAGDPGGAVARGDHPPRRRDRVRRTRGRALRDAAAGAAHGGRPQGAARGRERGRAAASARARRRRGALRREPVVPPGAPAGGPSGRRRRRPAVVGRRDRDGADRPAPARGPAPAALRVGARLVVHRRAGLGAARRRGRGVRPRGLAPPGRVRRARRTRCAPLPARADA